MDRNQGTKQPFLFLSLSFQVLWYSNRKLINLAKEMAQWLGACCARVRTCIKIPTAHRKQAVVRNCNLSVPVLR